MGELEEMVISHLDGVEEEAVEGLGQKELQEEAFRLPALILLQEAIKLLQAVDQPEVLAVAEQMLMGLTLEEMEDPEVREVREEME